MNTPNLEGISVLVDGGCLNNNKPVVERSMYGSLTAFCDGKQVVTTHHVLGPVEQDIKCVVHKYSIPAVNGHASNNMAEVVMLRRAMEYILSVVHRQISQPNPKKLDLVTVMSDSEWALGVVTGAYKIKAANEVHFHNDLTSIQHIKSALEKHGVTVVFQHVDNLWVKSVLGH